MGDQDLEDQKDSEIEGQSAADSAIDDQIGAADIEHTPETDSIQGKEDNSEKNQADNQKETNSNKDEKPEDWKPETTEEHLDVHIGKLNENFSVKEAMKIRVLEIGINQAYYNMWSKEANSIFRRIVVLKHRLGALKNKPKAS